MTKSAFQPGNTVRIDPASGFNGRAEILAIRHEIGNTRTGELALAADVLREDGKVTWYFLNDIARWNPPELRKLEAGAPALATMLQEALAYCAAAFEQNDHVNAADMVEWFAEWRERARDALLAAGITKGVDR